MTETRTLTTMKKALFQAIAVATLAILPATAQAVPIAGDLTLAGAVRVTATDIDFLDSFAGGNEFIVIPDPGPADYFSFLAGTLGDAADLNYLLQPAGPAGFPPLANFLTFDADAGLSFTLEAIAACDPATCFFPGTPFNIFQTFNDTTGKFDTTVQMAMRGTVQDTTADNGGDGSISTWAASYTATFQGQSIDQVMADFNADNQIDAPYSTEINVTAIPTPREVVPEPATLLTFGAGTALMAAHRRRRARKSAQ
jgi:hypothetical protein